MTRSEDEVPSPCVGICRLDSARRHCVACRRTLAEIGGWADMDARARRAVWARIVALGETRDATNGDPGAEPEPTARSSPDHDGLD